MSARHVMILRAPASNYDAAVAALAPFLADGWITQDWEIGAKRWTTSYTPDPMAEPQYVEADDAVGEYFWTADPACDGILLLPLYLGLASETKRRILGGKVVST